MERSEEKMIQLARLLVIAFGILPEIATAECTSLIKGAVAIDVQTCGAINPEAFDTSKEKYKVVGDLDPDGRKILLDQYRGLAIKGHIVRSQAIRDGLNPAKGALQGETLTIFVLPGHAQCAAINGKRIAAQLQEKCCDGTADAPCLLGTGLTIGNIKVAGEAATGSDGKSTGAARPAKAHGKEYKAAEAFFAKKKFKDAAAEYRKADDAGDMDVRGLYRWGQSLRDIEDCGAAVAPLKRVYDLSQKGKIWADDEIDYRRAIFLLARCHAKQSDAASAVFYLNGFLLDPKKYRTELQQSLKHKDFGWIHTTKEYREYRADAQKKLNQK